MAVEGQEAEPLASKPRKFLGSQRPFEAGFCRVVPARNRGRLVTWAISECRKELPVERERHLTNSWSIN